MKYNKIAMLVAGGLMVGAVNAVYANTTNTVSVVTEYGSIEEYNITGGSVTLTPDGAETYESMLSDYAAGLSDTDGWCVRSNSVSAFEPGATAALNLTATDANTTQSIQSDMGGYTLNLAVNALQHSNLIDLENQAKGVIDTKVAITYMSEPTGADDHKHMDTAAGSCNATSSKFKLETFFPDTDVDKYAGDYAGSISLTLTGHTDQS